MIQRQKINTTRVSCIERGQKDGPTLTVNKKIASLDNCFLHRYVIKQSIENNWEIWGCVIQYSLNNLTTVSIASRGGVQSLGISCVKNSNQLSGTKFFKEPPPHNVPVLSFHQEVIQLTTLPHKISSAVSFSGTKSNGFCPVIMPSKRYPQDKPSMSSCLIRVPPTWIT